MKYVNAKELLMFLQPPITRLSVFTAETLDAAMIMCAQAFPKLEKEFQVTIDFPTFKFQLMKTMSTFIEERKEAEEPALQNPQEHVATQRYIANHIQIALWPKHLQKKTGENFFIINYVTTYADILFRYLLDSGIPRDVCQQLASQSLLEMAKWIDENCIKKCSYQCIRRNASHGYCALCSYMIQPMPCPKKNEITYERCGVPEEECNCMRK